MDVVVKVNTLLPLPGAEMEEGLNAAVTPVGNPVALRATAEFRAEFVAEVIVIVPDVPGSNEIGDAEAERVSAGARTITVTVAELEMVPLLATTLKL